MKNLKLKILVVLCLLSVNMFLSCGLDYKTALKDGYFNSYHSKTIGELFDSYFKNDFFDSPKWKVENSVSSGTFVSCTGKAFYYSKLTKLKVLFLIEDTGVINVTSLSVDGKAIAGEAGNYSIDYFIKTVIDCTPFYDDANELMLASFKDKPKGYYSRLWFIAFLACYILIVVSVVVAGDMKNWTPIDESYKLDVKDIISQFVATDAIALVILIISIVFTGFNVFTIIGIVGIIASVIWFIK